MQKVLLASFLFYAFTLQASEIEPPNGVLTLDEMVNIFRSPFRRKMQDLSESYIIRNSTSAVEYQTAKDTTCFHRTFSSGSALVRALVGHETKDNYLREHIIYDDCYQPRSLIEEITSQGKNLTPASLRQISRGERTFSLSSDVNDLLYRIGNSDGENILTLNIKAENNGNWRAVFAIVSQPVVIYKFDQTIVANRRERRWSWAFPAADIQYARPGSKWRYSYSQSPTLQIIQVLDSTTDDIISTRYMSQSTNISQNDFQTAFQQEISLASKKEGFGRLAIARQMVEYHIMSFPSTSFVGTVGQNQRILNELRLANIRLLSNIEINLVQQFIQSLILALEKGLLSVEDRRP